MTIRNADCRPLVDRICGECSTAGHMNCLWAAGCINDLGYGSHSKTIRNLIPSIKPPNSFFLKIFPR